jgi:hypothetical protein
MIREQALRARQKLVSKLPTTGELLRGSLLERTVRHTKDCPKCARGEGHHVFVLTVTYAGHNLYVAMTRGSKKLIICSQSPMLNVD